MDKRIYARLLCDSVTPTGNNEEVTFVAATDGRENETFHTTADDPTVDFTLLITNPAAKGAFREGQRYTIRFEAVET